MHILHSFFVLDVVKLFGSDGGEVCGSSSSQRPHSTGEEDMDKQRNDWALRQAWSLMWWSDHKNWLMSCLQALGGGTCRQRQDSRAALTLPCPKWARWCCWVSVLCWSQAPTSISSGRWSYGGSVCRRCLGLASGHPESSPPPLLPWRYTQTLSSSTVVLSERPCRGFKRPRLRCCHLPLKLTLSNRINPPKWGERSAFAGGKTTVNNKSKQKEKNV